MKALVLIALAACGVPATQQQVSPREAPPAWQARPSGGTRAIDPGVRADHELLDARGCATCHAAIVDEWSQSRHALAWTNGIFQREYSARPQAWCVNCHAPLTTQQANITGTHAAQGVDCATCHVRSGKLVSAKRGATSPHGTIADPSFGTPAFCADCHQFTFPVLDETTGAATAMTRHPMQTTVAAFQAGPFAKERDGCMTCHGSKTNHAFAGAHDRGMREAAVDVTWCARGEQIDVGVRNANAGHSVPTGDIHRHMYLRVWRASAPEAMFQAFFGRRFEPVDDGGKRTVWDSTIAPGETKRFAVPAASLAGDAGEPINLELVYVFIEHEFPRKSDEPTTASITRRQQRIEELAPCDAAAPKLAITMSSVGRLRRLEWWKQREDENAKLIQAALAPDLPGIATRFEVMDIPGEVETEEGYWSVRRGDKEIVQVIRRTGDPDTQLPAAMIVWTPEVPTYDGTKVGDTLGAALAKHADIVCTNTPGQLIAEAVAADVQCQSPTEPSIVYILDANKKKLKTGKPAAPSLANIPIVAIAVLPR